MKNIGASIRDRLAIQARSSGVPLTALMERFVIGRLLWRVSQSASGRKFVLKGAQLFSLWTNTIHRPTRDLDLLSFGDSSPENVRTYFAELLAAPADPPDGLLWGAVHASQIREDQNYGGVRITVKATLSGAIIPAQIDVGFGDVITPAPVEMNWHDLLGFPEARLLAYPPETVIAEKIHAAAELGMANSRMKDFYDLYWLCGNMEFRSGVLSDAIRATFRRRDAALPEDVPPALTQVFAEDATKTTQWNAFLRKNRLKAPKLPEVILRLRDFLHPVLVSAEDAEDRIWKPRHGWKAQGAK
jgi:predicted nucleotidyltransferase component of viral defense system